MHVMSYATLATTAIAVVVIAVVAAVVVVLTVHVRARTTKSREGPVSCFRHLVLRSIRASDSVLLHLLLDDWCRWLVLELLDDWWCL